MDNRSVGLRYYAGTIVTVALTLSGLALAGPSQAADHEKRKGERIIIVTKDGKHADGEHSQIRIHSDKGEHRRVRIIGPQHGDDHVRVIHPEGEHRIHIIGPEGMRGCSGDGDAIDEGSGEGRDRTRVMVCTSGDESDSVAERIERLEKVRTRIGSDDELSDERKARISAALDAEIARLRRSE
jgi:hypothetical protein